ncbi:hypothetical protein WA026_015513 [Henosepilachna vigintioctopunctata]|uniref:WKF domain-containing protein n=1 Tax=Henosepilachna vigintioctopunctata TaxID=420089 RepID=A0AAW1V782_9CUCU
MTGNERNLEAPKKHRQRGKNRRIGFSDEIVTKTAAETLLFSGDQKLCTKSDIKNLKEMKQSIIAKKLEHQSNETSRDKQTLEKQAKTIDPEDTENNVKDIEQSEEIKKDTGSSLSKRAMKKMKYQQLLDGKKKEVDLKLKKSAFEYLSNWKHNKINWKFEKLKQIWLLQNLYDSSKIEESIWSIVVEYFSHSKGKVHKTILDEAIKIVEKEGTEVDNGEIKLSRARDLIQNLQD